MVNVTVPWGTVTYFQLNMGHLAYNHPETKVKTISNLDIVLSFVSFPAQSALHSSLVADWKSSLPALCVIDPVLVEIIRQMKYFSKTRWLCQPPKKKQMPDQALQIGLDGNLCVFECVCIAIDCQPE